MIKKALLPLTILSVCLSFVCTSCSSDENYNYRVRWCNDDGTILEEEIYKRGELPVYKGEEPKKEADNRYHYLFSGWDKEIVEVKDNQYYYAEYDEYVVVTWLNYDYEEVLYETLCKVGEIPVYRGRTPTKPSDDYYTYTFTGFSLENQPVYWNTTIYAEFAYNHIEYTVTWKNYDGSILDRETYYAGSYPSYKGATPTRERSAKYTYAFTGWSPQFEKVFKNIEYRAQFSQSINSYIVTWRNYDGSILDQETYEYGQTPVYKGLTPERAPDNDHHYVFSSWSTEPASVIGDADYYAQYDKYVLITWQNIDGVIIKEELCKLGNTPVYTGDVPEIPDENDYHHSFVGWYPEIAEAISDTTYTATYDSAYGFVIDNNGVLTSCTLTNSSSITIPSSVTKINSAAFSGNFANAKSLFVPDGVTVEKGAFKKFTYLESLSVEKVTKQVRRWWNNDIIGYDGTENDSIAFYFDGMSNNYDQHKGTIKYLDGSNRSYDYNFKVPKTLKNLVIRKSLDIVDVGSMSINFSYDEHGQYKYFSGAGNAMSSFFYSLNETVENIYLGSSISVVPPGTFCCMNKLKHVYAETPISVMGYHAFYRCKELCELPSLSDNLYIIDRDTFGSCTSLTNITTLPNNLKIIGESAFYYCTSLQNVYIPDGVTEIGKSAFNSDSSLRAIRIPNSITSIGDNAFTISFYHHIGGTDYNGCTYLGNESNPYLCAYKANDTSIEFNELHPQCKIVCSGAFYNCQYLKTFYIPESVSQIGAGILSKCTSINSLATPFIGRSRTDTQFLGYFFGGKNASENKTVVPESLKTIALYDDSIKIDGAFSNCEYLETITLPDGISIYYAPFSGCKNLKTIVLSETSGTSCSISGCSSLETFSIPSGIKSISFSSCSSLTDIYLNDGVYYVSISECPNINFTEYNNCLYLGSLDNPYYMLYSVADTSLATYTIHNNCKCIDRCAFANCSSLTSIDIPSSVISIGRNAFEKCVSLTSIIIPNSVLVMDSTVFSDCNNILIYCEASEKPEGWSSFWNQKSSSNLSKYSVVWSYSE